LPVKEEGFRGLQKAYL